MDSMQKTERLLAIALLLQARGKMTAKRLAAILGVSKRTVYRDIMSLSLAHVPVSMDYGPGGGYYLPDDYHLEPAHFTREEAISLILSTDMSGSYDLFADDDDLHRALIKLESVLSEEYRADVKVARDRILFDTSAWCGSDPSTSYLETIRAAVLGANQLDVLYPCTLCSDSMQACLAWRRIEPYGLVFKGVSRRHVRTGVWYLVAFCQSCQTFEPLLVDSIEQIQVCPERVTLRADFNLRAYWREARKHLEKPKHLLVLTLYVSLAGRHNVKGNVKVLEEQPDGSVIVCRDMASFDDALAYALRFGADAVVLEPESVRAAVAATAHAIAEMYR